MEEYNLEEAFDRLEIPKKYKNRIKIVNTGKDYKLRKKIGEYFPFLPVGFFHPLTNYSIIDTKNGKHYTDYILAHEIIGHKMKGVLGIIKLGNRSESYAVEKGLEKMIELSKDDPKYLELFDKEVAKIKKNLEKDYETKNPLKLFGKIHKNLMYYNNLDLKKLEKLRNNI